MVRVVVLSLETGETFTEDIGDDNPVALYVEGRNAHGYEALTDCLFCYFVTEEYDPASPDEHGVARVRSRGAVDQTLRRGRRASAAMAHRLKLVDELGMREELRHGAERQPPEILVEPRDDHANAALGEAEGG